MYFSLYVYYVESYVCRVGLYTELFSNIISTLFLYILLHLKCSLLLFELFINAQLKPPLWDYFIFIFCNLRIWSFSCHNRQVYDRQTQYTSTFNMSAFGWSVNVWGRVTRSCFRNWEGIMFPLVRHLKKCPLIWIWMKSALLGSYLYRSANAMATSLQSR